MRRAEKVESIEALAGDVQRATVAVLAEYRGLTVGEHVRNMFWTAGPALAISLVLFLIIGLNAEPTGAASTDAAQRALEAEFNISPLNLLPLGLLVVFSIKKFPPFLAILGSALFAGILACFTQWTVVQAFVDDPSLGPLATSVKAIFGSMATGFASTTQSAVRVISP